MWQKILARIRGFHFRIPTAHEFMHKSFAGVHSLYFGAVWMEAHGMYGNVAGVLLVYSVLDWFMHFGGE